MSAHSLKTRMGGYWDLLKPRLIFLVILSAMAGFYLAGQPGAETYSLWSALLGISLVSAGSMALNQWMEREADSKMVRTQERPLPRGILTPKEAFWTGFFLSAAGLAVLVGGGHAAAAVLAAVTLFLYIAVYTPLKKITPWCTLIGALPGALPTLTGWAAVEWPFSQRAWALFAILFVWQMPHFLAISWLWRDDYKRAGFRILSVEDATGKRVARQMAAYVALLLPLSLVPVWIGMAGWIYGAAAGLLGLYFLIQSFRAIQNIDRYARPVFRTSILYLTILLILLMLDKQ